MPTTTLQIPTPDGPADAFAAFPDGGGRHPGVLMYPDAFGIRPVIHEMAQELASHGYYVLVPNYLHRDGATPVVEIPSYIGGEERETVVARVMPLIMAHTREQSLTDAEAFLGFLAARPEVEPGPVGVTGYCFGGLLAVRAAAAHPERVAAVAAFHAPVAADGPETFERLTAKAHFGHAAGDVTPEALEELDLALKAAGVDHTSEIYPDTQHGFTMADTYAFDAAGLRRHWERLLPLLRTALTSS
ncbi:dienelactone hydrolase family protein [Streptomyces sp. NRRL WC-3742]|uniref:dienelactone hydrolase family protein n=1 Tax=Streptomyces sp. NRRL WC-3742 TaxID=1463934 RepID=UPI0004C9E266|nr:dienelactone hydrolase family protein [Streptomyces sp. NRRL WC-3742]